MLSTSIGFTRVEERSATATAIGAMDTIIGSYNDGYCSNRCRSEAELNQAQKRLIEEQRRKLNT